MAACRHPTKSNEGENMKKNHFACLGNLLAVFILGSAGCEYYTTKPYVVQADPTERKTVVESQDSPDEVIVPQTAPVRDAADPKPQEPQSLQPEPEMPEEDREDPKPDTETDPYHVLKPRVGMEVPEIPPQEEIAKLVLGDAATELDTLGGSGGDHAEAFSSTMEGVDCAINKIVTDSSAVLDHVSFSFEEPENIAKGVKGFYDRDVSFGGVPNGNRTTIIPPSQYVFTGFVAYVCPRPKGWNLIAQVDVNDRVICGFRPIAKKMERTGLVDDAASLWIGPAVGTTGITVGPFYGPRITHSIAAGDDAIKIIVAQEKSSREDIDDKNTIAYETCPAGQVLSGFKGAADGMVTQLIGICRPVVAQ
jgi:hypothetical protein